MAVKGPSLASVAAIVGSAAGPGHGGAHGDERRAVVVFSRFRHGVSRHAALRSVDPKGEIDAALPARRIVGCVVHASCSTPEPGLVRHHGGQRLIIGEPAGDPAPRTQAIAAQLTAAGFDVEVSPCIQRDIWYKLWGNMTMNPISALTGATMDRILDDELVKRFCLAAMREAAAIGARIGCPIEQSGEDRIAVTRRLGAVKTSMLQDVEAHRQVEIDVLLSAVREIGERVRGRHAGDRCAAGAGEAAGESARASTRRSPMPRAARGDPSYNGPIAAAAAALRAQDIRNERQEIRFAGRPGSQEGQLRQAVRPCLCVHGRGRSEHRHRRRRRCGDGHRHAGHAGDGAGRHPAHPHGQRQADPLCRAVALSRGARARRLGLRGAARHRQPRHLRSDRRARRSRHEKRDRAFSAPVPGGRIGAGPDVADAGVRKADDALDRQAAGRDHAARTRPHQGRHRRLAAAGTDPLLRRSWSNIKRRRTPAMPT